MTADRVAVKKGRGVRPWPAGRGGLARVWGAAWAGWGATWAEEKEGGGEDLGGELRRRDGGLWAASTQREGEDYFRFFILIKSELVFVALKLFLVLLYIFDYAF